jgi:hypothetical protein
MDESGIPVSPLRWLPPKHRPWNESTGHLGYFARVHLHPPKFDLMDCDGAWPPVWVYWKARSHVLRCFEEKLQSQTLHDSQWRIYDLVEQLIALGIAAGILDRTSAVFTIFEAERLSEDPPRFPIRVQRFRDRMEMDFDAPTFKRWLQREDDPRLLAAAGPAHLNGALRLSPDAAPRCPHCGREVAGASGPGPVVCVLCSGVLNGWKVQT